MSGGEIIGNTVSSDYGPTDRSGGGVYVNNGTFTMTGGTISSNSAVGTVHTQSESYGGGVCVGNNGIFTMTGGTISSNKATGYTSGHKYGGGGVYMSNNATFRIVNGTIYGSGEGALSNTVAPNGNAAIGAALYNAGTAQRGTFSSETWVSSGSLSTTDDTIRVVNGALQ
jgi:hypothetical protein